MICGITYGNTFNTTVNTTYRSTSVYISPGRGLTYGQNIQQETYRTPRIGYSTYRGQEHYGETTLSYDSNDVYSTNETHGQPRRAPWTSSEGVSRDYGGFVITWAVNAGFLGITYWKITYSDGTSETFWGSHNEAVAHAQQKAEEKAKQKYVDAMATPIGDPPYICLLLATGFYIFKRRKRKTCC